MGNGGIRIALVAACASALFLVAAGEPGLAAIIGLSLFVMIVIIAEAVKLVNGRSYRKRSILNLSRRQNRAYYYYDAEA